VGQPERGWNRNNQLNLIHEDNEDGDASSRSEIEENLRREYPNDRALPVEELVGAIH